MIDKAQENPYTLIEQVEYAKSRQELESLTDALVKQGEHAVIALLEKMPKLLSSRLHTIGARVFARVGYPANAMALDFMVSDASNTNSSTYETSFEALVKIGAPILPIVEDALDFYRKQDNEGNALEIDSLEDLKKQISK